MPILGATTAPGSAGDAKTHGMLPTQSAAANTAALQAACDVIGARGGGVVSILEPGTYLLAAQGAHPVYGNKKYVLYLKYDNVRLELGAGVTLKLAGGQQTNAGGAVDFIVFIDRTGITISGGRISNNATQQPGWTGGYSQSAVNGSLISAYGTAGHGNHDILITGVRLEEAFGCPVNIENDPAGRGSYSRFHDLRCRNCGEGPQMVNVDGVEFINVLMEDPAGVCVGDGQELAMCTDFIMRGCRVKSGGAGAGFDLFGSQRGILSDFIVDGFQAGVTLQSQFAAPFTKADDITVCDGQLLNLRDIALQAPEGSAKFVNIKIKNPAAGVVPVQIAGGAGLGAIEVDNVTIDGHTATAILITGSRVVTITNPRIRNGVGAATNGIQIGRAAAGDNPVVAIAGGRITSQGNFGIFIQAAGDAAYKPQVSIKGVDVLGNTGGGIGPADGTGLDNVEIESCQVPDSTSRTLVAGCRRLIDSSGTVSTLGKGHANQLLEIVRTAAGTSTINDVATGGTNINLLGSERLILEVGDRLVVRYNPAGGDWYEVSRSQAGSGTRRIIVDGWFLDNVAANLANQPLTRGAGTISARFYMPLACHVRGFGGAVVASRTAGTLTFGLWWNGGGPNKTAVIDATNPGYIHNSYNRGNAPVAAGAYFEVKVTTDAAWAPAAGDIVAWVDLEI
ncbi:MAG TPA: right-handed parallel beta-helix repeat-containing protein [Candidatus Binatia bacterium]|jgi:hypothetical protein